MARVVGVGLAALLVTAGCAGGDAPPRPPPGPSPSSSAAASPSSSPSSSAASRAAPAATLAPVPGWTAGRGEVAPGVKTAATAYLRTAGTWTSGEGTAAAVASRLRRAGVGAAAARDAAVLSHRAAGATVRVVYPQYGGLTGGRASVMVVVEQRLLHADGRTASRSLVLDVRVSRGSGRAVVTGIEPPSPAGRRHDAGRPGRAVLEAVARKRITMPGSSVDDVRRGRVDGALLTLLARLAGAHRLDVTVLRTGHPRTVFGTGRVSNHTHGRAVDIWRVDGHAVVDPATPRPLLRAVMTRAARLGATEVGGPFDVNGPGPGFFTDDVHRDHLHLGITPGRRPPRP